MNYNPLILTDFYKTGHYKMYTAGTSKIYSNLTPRKSRFPTINKVVVFGIQYFLMEYLIKQWGENFFDKEYTTVAEEYQRMMDNTLGKGAVTPTHIRELHTIGRLPLCIKALKEGTLSPIGVPVLTITNTEPEAYWLVNYLETILSCTVWQPMTSATLAYEYRKMLDGFCEGSGGDPEFVKFQAHDFAMRGMSSLESACTSGAGHLLSFVGTDTIPAISFLEKYYGADVTKELVGTSVPATEHSVMTLGMEAGEFEIFSRLLDLYPTGILSVVSDSFDLWKVLTEYLPALKDKILARNGKLVIRPDSGDPVDIVCGGMYKTHGKNFDGSIWTETVGPNDGSPASKGVIELLWDTFGGTVNEKGYKVLDLHVGVIYGDSINLQRCHDMCTRAMAKGFCTTNFVLGVGSYTFQYVSRDSLGWAIKATYAEIAEPRKEHEHFATQVFQCREIFKDPITDDGTKKSARGLLRVDRGEDGELVLRQQVTKEEEEGGELEVVFLDGELKRVQSLEEIRQLLRSQTKHLVKA
jgi:nicotinamide phosphoribosyltransferase